MRLRGLSPILSTMILLSAALIAGLLLYTYFTNTMKGMTSAPNIAIVQASYYPSIDMLYIKVRNYGGAPVDVNGSSVKVVAGKTSCTCTVTCSSPAMLRPYQSITFEIYPTQGNGTVSIPGCTVTCSNGAACAEALVQGSGYAIYNYVYAGSEQSTQPVSITLG